MITYIAETEKAVKLCVTGYCYALEKYLPSKEVWVPRSLLSAHGIPGIWITSVKASDTFGDRVVANSEVWWVDAEGGEFEAEPTDNEIANARLHQAARQAGIDALGRLITYGKSHGVKGLRKGLKRSTVLRKFAEAGVEAPTAEQLDSYCGAA